ncbi:hypothetical protein CC86DRAFT_58717 [Ophiobolus disseminans]|uniref:Myb-like domain-containing protein n=1 Tax=Ophiobolus disseminans TaxID=1469910 RepID=A0A6A6ZTC9_9PLEO|nr:hypothetical protein CC86DRAFT_58717 [Ophiobolus disseminans]
MSTNRYPDNNRYPRDRSPPYRDRRPSNFSGYPPRGSDSNGRPNPDPSGFPPRDPPRGPKSLGDTPRGPVAGPPSSAPSAPRDGRGRGFAGRGEDTPLRNAPPLSSGPPANSHNSWRADRDRDRDREFDRRERRPTPPRRSPIRDTRDLRDQRDFVPRDLDVNRARRNSRDGPPSAGSTYSDPPPGAGSSYRGGTAGRGTRGGGFVGRIRPFHNDDRDRHHDPRERERTWRPRSRSPIRRERDVRDERRDERDIDRRERDDRRFVQREYDSYIGPAGAAKPGPRALDTHRGPGPPDSRYMPGTPTGPTPHSSHHVSPSDRLGSQGDLYSRRSSLAIDSSAPKDPRRDLGKDDALLASRAEASRERYAPRPSSPPAAVPAFGSNVWRAPTLEAKPNVASNPPPKPAASVAPAPVAPTPIPASTVPIAPSAPKSSVPPGLAIAPPTGPKADRAPGRPPGEVAMQEDRLSSSGPSLNPSPAATSTAVISPGLDKAQMRAPVLPPNPAPPSGPSTIAHSGSIHPTPSMHSISSVPARSPPQGPAPKPRPPPIAPQAAYRANASPQFARAPFPPHAPRDASPNPISAGLGVRNGVVSSVNTSPKDLPANIPTGPKADRTLMAPRPPTMYPPPDRSSFSIQRAPISGGPKSMQWVRPGLIPNRPSVPSKREFPNDDRERSFGTAPKAPRLEASTSATQPQRLNLAKSESPSFPRALTDLERPRERAASAERSVAPSPKPGSIETRRHSDVFMAEGSPRVAKPLMSAASSAPEVMQDSDDDLDLDEGDFAGSEAKYNRERELLEARKVDLSVHHVRAVSPLQELVLLHCLTIRHLPTTSEEAEAKHVEEDVPMHDDALVLDVPKQEDVASPLPMQGPRESVATEPLTPQHEATEDIDMEEKEERSLAPATVALRLRRRPSTEQDSMPDLSALPYLGSGPPTPISDIEQDRPKLPESVMVAIRDKLRKSIEPGLNTEGTLQQYATLYRQWRYNTRPMDEEREQEEQERQPSAEPSLKATTPDVTTAAMTGLLEPLPAATGRRSHSSRWATELDLEQVIKESLKTAEEERMGKKDKDPRRAMADPEKEADLPLEIVESEAERRRYTDTNFQRAPGEGILVFHYEPPEDDFTEEEHRVMVQNYRDQYAKKWGKLAEILYKETGAERTYKDCINHYYATKWGREYKGKLRRGRGGPRSKRGGAVARGRGAIVNMERPEAADDGMPLALTESGRPRRSAAPTFGPTLGGNEMDFDSTAATVTPGRARRQTDADGTQEKGRRGKAIKEKGSRKAKNLPLAAAPAGSPLKIDRKEKAMGVKTEDDFGKRPFGDALPMSIPVPMSVQPGLIEDQIMIPSESIPGMSMNMIDRPKTQAGARPGPSSYWSVSELGDFDKNVAHFGTDWLAIANHMGTKTHTMIKNQYLRLIEQGRADLEQVATEADTRRERGDRLGPPPTPTPAPKRRYESTQTALPRQIAPTPELHKSPPLDPLAVPKMTPPHSAPPSRFSTIAQAPALGKPLVPVTGFPSMPETSLASLPSLSQQQSPPAPPQRPQPQHHPALSQHKSQHPGPRAGYFSEDLTSRHENRPPSQSSHQPSRLMQHMPAMRGGHEHHQSHSYRSFGHEREGLNRSEIQQDQDAQNRYQHSRRISQEMGHHRTLGSGSIPPLAPPVRSNSVVRSPEHRSISYSHGRHSSQNQQLGQQPSDLHSQTHNNLPGAQQQTPSRATILTPPVKEEPRHPPPSSVPQAQPPLMQSQHPLHSQYTQPSVQNTPAPAAPKAAPEPRKSNLMSLLNDTETEEPRRKKICDSGPPSHSTTPQQQTPIAPPPPPPTSQALPPRRNPYDDPYVRQSYAQQSALPSASSNRPIDLTSDQAQVGRPSMRDPWQQRPQQFNPNHSQASQSTPISSHSSLPQPPFSDGRLLNHRSVFAQHNGPRHNPSPPPHAAYNNSPHMHSRTPSISGAPSQSLRHGIPSTTAPQHASTPSASGGLILQPNPYAQVDPSGGSAPPTGPMGMRPSPHLHTSHLVQQRDAPGRNEHSQSHNATISYSNPQTPNEHSSHQPPRGPAGLADPYRPRDPRDLHHDFESRIHSDRDTGRELSQRADNMLREQLSNPALRSNSLHDDLRYQSHLQDRGYLSQRSHTPLSRPDHNQPPTLQHPPNSSLGINNHPMYGQRTAPEEPPHRFGFNPRDRSLTERIREDQAQQQAAMHREEFARRDERDRELHLRDQQMRDNLLRGNMRGPPPPGSGPGPTPDPRAPAGPGPHDWTSAVRHPPDRHGWQR